MPQYTDEFYRSTEYREKMSKAIKKSRAKETRKQRNLRNAKISVSYLISRYKGELADRATKYGRIKKILTKIDKAKAALREAEHA